MNSVLQFNHSRQHTNIPPRPTAEVISTELTLQTRAIARPGEQGVVSNDYEAFRGELEAGQGEERSTLL